MLGNKCTEGKEIVIVFSTRLCLMYLILQILNILPCYLDIQFKESSIFHCVFAAALVFRVSDCWWNILIAPMGALLSHSKRDGVVENYLTQRDL